MGRWRGWRDLVFDGVEVITGLVERTHRDSTQRVARRYIPVEGAEDAAQIWHTLTAVPVYRIVQAVNRVVGTVARAATDTLVVDEAMPEGAPMRSDAAGTQPWLIDQIQAVVTGFLGDHLAARGNALANPMQLRHEGRVVALERDALLAIMPDETGRVCIFVHGLSTTEWSWCIGADAFYDDPAMTLGQRLRAEAGYVPLYVRYNTGQRVVESGAELAALLDGLWAASPWPITSLVLIGHSMGGLVVRAAAQAGAARGATWSEALERVVCLGSPHHGAPLEKFASFVEGVLSKVDAAGAQAPGEVLSARSAGIRDLRWGPGAATGEAASMAMVEGVEYLALSATITHDPEHPLGQLVGDFMVRTASGVGEHPDPSRRIPFQTRQVLAGIGHIQLANHPAVHEVVVQQLSEAPPGA